uniref:Stearoyl-CoA desaturase n=1 Tax=Spermophilus dauricus TaxID=99837 RepID=A0A8C9QNY3_SPEDA
VSPFFPSLSSSYTTTTTITAPPKGSPQNEGEKLENHPLYSEEDIRPEMKDDIYDPSYQDAEGPRPKFEFVWRNIILMCLLHLGALYGIILVPNCKFYTWLWGLAERAVGPCRHWTSPRRASLLRPVFLFSVPPE